MFNIDDNCTAFDVAIAMYIWLSEWHDGQWSDRYSAMCKMGSDYNLQVRGGLDESRIGQSYLMNGLNIWTINLI
jgi:hypothetical protein